MKQRYLALFVTRDVGKNINKLQHPYFCLGVVENTILHRGEQEKYSRKTILHRGEQEKYSRKTIVHRGEQEKYSRKTIVHRGEQEKYSRKTKLHKGEQEKYSRYTLILITMVLDLQFFCIHLS